MCGHLIYFLAIWSMHFVGICFIIPILVYCVKKNLETPAKTATASPNVSKCDAKVTHPVFSVDVLVCVPLSREEWVLLGNDFAVEERRQRWVLLRQALDLQVAAQVRVVQVHVLKR
jgi:hypothetical protein